MNPSRGIFLTGEWRYLVMANYRVDAALLRPLLPRGTELDAWNGHTYASLVGFLFRRTRVLGVPIPLHQDFEEVNLRFYVRREVRGEVRRAVTFIKEIVPRPAIAAVARVAYNEPYVALPMRHAIERETAGDAAPGRVRYEWREPGGWSALTVDTAGVAAPIEPASEAEFITEHYWGYTRQRDGGTVEYEVRHPRWRTWAVTRTAVEGDLAATYGPAFASALSRPPDSAFLAEGSAISVHRPLRIGV